MAPWHWSKIALLINISPIKDTETQTETANGQAQPIIIIRRKQKPNTQNTDGSRPSVKTVHWHDKGQSVL